MKFSDYELKMKQLNVTAGTCLLNTTNSSIQRSAKGINPNDEGKCCEIDSLFFIYLLLNSLWVFDFCFLVFTGY